MQALARHLIRDHGYPTVAYLGGYADSPDSLERREVLRGRGGRGRRDAGVRTGMAGLLLRLGRRQGDQPAARRGPRTAPRDRVRQRPDRARRHVRAARARHQRARRGRGDRLRRHPDGPPPAHDPDHRPPADQGDGRDRVRGALFDDQRRAAAGARHHAAHRADPPGELRLPGGNRQRRRGVADDALLARRIGVLHRHRAGRDHPGLLHPAADAGQRGRRRAGQPARPVHPGHHQGPGTAVRRRHQTRACGRSTCTSGTTCCTATWASPPATTRRP